LIVESFADHTRCDGDKGQTFEELDECESGLPAARRR